MTLTLDNIPPDLDTALRRKADQEHRTVDQIAVEAMRAGLLLAKGEPNVNGNTSLVASIRARFRPLGGIELTQSIREPMPEPLDLR
jgi:hypothetical protein